ncbi:AraC family transcriptional regulator [Dyadobacter sp. CY261]|uniref:AraC family transcriptional regulator n=1 Tax=Dyadobacter sp. CY261 TaxID=2907203 RepID=UPI001F1C8EAA|nr:AraC family transcriptional regulator [Dyadobacter sp. CY261]MCF0074311.1 AraC family transcriptional regulator [Dyadobacter sp. CY261]
METSRYPCHFEPTISNEQFIPDHIFVYLETGFMNVFYGNSMYELRAGDYCFVTRNHLARYHKGELDGKPFKSVSVFISQEFLRVFSQEYGHTAETVECTEDNAIIQLNHHPMLESYVQSMRPYMQLDGEEKSDFMVLKTKELVLLLLKTNPALKNILFDFSDPGKIDLEDFMNRNFRFNVNLQRFSYLSGRSLTIFKEDFKKVFNTSPGKWLMEKRLTEARFQIETLGRMPSEVYLEVGFEDLSHFSFAFKKMFGSSPNQFRKVQA